MWILLLSHKHLFIYSTVQVRASPHLLVLSIISIAAPMRFTLASTSAGSTDGILKAAYAHNIDAYQSVGAEVSKVARSDAEVNVMLGYSKRLVDGALAKARIQNSGLVTLLYESVSNTMPFCLVCDAHTGAELLRHSQVAAHTCLQAHLSCWGLDIMYRADTTSAHCFGLKHSGRQPLLNEAIMISPCRN